MLGMDHPGVDVLGQADLELHPLSFYLWGFYPNPVPLLDVFLFSGVRMNLHFGVRDALPERRYLTAARMVVLHGSAPCEKNIGVVSK